MSYEYIIEIPTISDERGSLSVVEDNGCIPFKLKRFFYLHSQNGSDRGGHAHRELEQFIIPISGTFKVRIDDGHSKTIIELSDLRYGLYIKPMIWVEVLNLKPNDVCLVAASDIYNEEDYIRDYDVFRKETQ